MANLAYLELAASSLISSEKTKNLRDFRKNHIEVRGFRHRVQRPINAVTGEVGTRRAHEVFTIRKDIDRDTSGLLRLAHKNNNVFKTWRLRLFHMPVTGSQVHYFTYSLQNARITDYRVMMPTLRDQASALIHEYEEISFIYEALTVTSEKHLSGIDGPLISGKTFAANATGSVFDSNWAEEQAKVAVGLVLKLLGGKAEDFASDANLSAAIRNKILGKPLGNTAGQNSTGQGGQPGQGPQGQGDFDLE